MPTLRQIVDVALGAQNDSVPDDVRSHIQIVIAHFRFPIVPVAVNFRDRTADFVFHVGTLKVFVGTPDAIRADAERRRSRRRARRFVS